jgi:hypothetical protein
MHVPGVMTLAAGPIGGPPYRRFLQRFKIAVLTGVAALSGYSIDTKRQKEREAFIPKLGMVPKSWCDKGLKKLEPELVKDIMSIYFLSRNYDEGRLVSSSDVPSKIAAQVAWGNVIVGTMDDMGGRIYHKDNIWRSLEESRSLFVEKLRERLLNIDKKEYKNLNQELQRIVDNGRAIVIDTIEHKVSDAKTLPGIEKIYRMPVN